MRSTRLVYLAVAALALTGCQKSSDSGTAKSAPSAAASSAADNGIAALTADEILQRTKAALTQVKSFAANGTVLQDGQPTEIGLKVNGTDFAGSMTVKDAKVELLSVGGEKFIRPNEQFWTLTSGDKGKTMATMMANRWVTGTDNDESLAGLFTMGDVNEMLKPTGTATKGEPKEIGGVPAIGLKDSGDPESVLYVATTGEPYPVQMVGKDNASLAFSDFGATFAEIAKPAAEQVVDLSKLTEK